MQDARFRRGDVGDVLERGRRAVVIDRNTVKQLRIRTTGANRYQIRTKHVFGLFHLGFGVILNFGNRHRGQPPRISFSIF